jgi:hypothetical protein
MSLSAGSRGNEPEFGSHARVEIDGSLDEAVRKTTDIEIVIYHAHDATPGKEPPPCIGHIHGTAPVIAPLSSFRFKNSSECGRLRLRDY